MNRKGAIGVFDSGFGGIDSLKYIVQALPDYNFIYLGDTARAPYGTRSQKIIYRFTKEGIEFLEKKNCVLIVLACNTASSQALPLFPKQDRNKTIGIIEPTVKKILEQDAKKVGVIGTAATVRSNIFKNKIREKNPEIEVFQNPAPLLVPIVEEGEENSKIADLTIKKYLASLLAKKIDTLVLGCTHFGILEGKIKKQTGENVKIIKEGPIVAEEVKSLLKNNPRLEEEIKKQGRVQFYTTDLTEKFVRLGSKFFGRRIKAEKAKL